MGSGELAAEALIQQGGLKCPVCSFVYGTKWEFNRHLKNKHGLKPAAETPEEPSTQYLYITEAEDVQGTQAAVAALQDLRYTSESGGHRDSDGVHTGWGGLRVHRIRARGCTARGGAGWGAASPRTLESLPPVAASLGGPGDHLTHQTHLCSSCLLAQIEFSVVSFVWSKPAHHQQYRILVLSTNHILTQDPLFPGDLPISSPVLRLPCFKIRRLLSPSASSLIITPALCIPTTWCSPSAGAHCAVCERTTDITQQVALCLLS